MNMDIIENVCMLLAFSIALLGSLFRYIEVPRRGYLCLCGFFLAHILSDYYWAVYTLVMGDYPDISAFVAYFGWNVGYLILVITSYHFREPSSRKYFHFLMLIPVPLNIIQCIIYNQFGGIFNNIWQMTLVTAAACLNLQQILYYLKNKRNGAHLPHFHVICLLFLTSQVVMWTSSCYFWPQDPMNPYYYCAFLNYIGAMLFPWAMSRDYAARGFKVPERNSEELRTQVRIQVVVSAIVITGLSVGYSFATWMKGRIPANTEDTAALSTVAVVLFAISIVMDVMLIGVMYIFQVFLTIGGGAKFVPLTGVTLPLVSYGGTSVLVTIVTFFIFEGLCVLRAKEHEKAIERLERMEQRELRERRRRHE